MSAPTLDRPAPVPSRPARRRSASAALPEVRWAAVSVALFAAGGLLQLTGAPAATWWAAYLACYVAGGWEPMLAGLQALREKTLDVDLLMVVAAVVAASIDQVLDGALLIIIFATSGALEAVATRRTRDAVTALLDLAPEHATRVAANGSEHTLLATDLAVDDLIRIRPGERVGADGVVVNGRSDVDQSSITGESVPAVKAAGDEVFAGTMNGTGAITVRVSRHAQDSVVARIVAMVEEASETKARTQLFVEKVEQRYSLLMVTATVVLFVVPLLLGAELQPTLLRAITFMIVASPCAVVLATMPPLLSAMANAGRHGVLVKSAVVMEQLGRIDTVAFDKTGTLTLGEPNVTTVDLAADATLPADEVLQLAASAELRSEHPLGRALVAAARARPSQAPVEPTAFTSVPGRGVAAVVDDRRVEVAAPDSTVEGLGALVAQRQAAGNTVVVVRVDGHTEAVISLADRVRPDAADALRALQTLTSHPPRLLTGDNHTAATRLADQVGIDEVHAELLPGDKVELVHELQTAGRQVALVGDGVNDAPAMATATVGIALGRRGSDLALQTADAVIVRDELRSIAAVVALSRRARRVVVANLVIAATVIAALVVWDLVGNLPLPLGVAGHEGSTVIVGLNGLRLLRRSAWRKAAQAPRR